VAQPQTDIPIKLISVTETQIDRDAWIEEGAHRFRARIADPA
jgi:hypothetical protein